MKKQFRHGDVLVVSVDSIPKDAKVLKGRQWIALGEKTGHHHSVDLVDSLFQTEDGKLYLKATKRTTLRHQEHKPIILEPGCYLVGVKRAYVAGSWTSVRD